MGESSDQIKFDIGIQDRKFIMPGQRTSVPDHIDWHLIQDIELSQLSRPESGGLGGFGFTFLGATLGLAPNSYQIIATLNSQQAPSLSPFDLASICMCFGSFVGALICLFLYWLNTRRNNDLVSKIRQRNKQILPDSRP